MKNCIHKIMGIAILLVTCGAVRANATYDAQDYYIYAGDFNADGMTDILYIAKDGSKASGIALSDGSGPNVPW